MAAPGMKRSPVLEALDFPSLSWKRTPWSGSRALPWLSAQTREFRSMTAPRVYSCSMFFLQILILKQHHRAVFSALPYPAQTPGAPFRWEPGGAALCRAHGAGWRPLPEETPLGQRFLRRPAELLSAPLLAVRAVEVTR